MQHFDFKQVVDKLAEFKTELMKIHETIGTSQPEMGKIYADTQDWLSEMLDARLSEENQKLRAEMGRFEDMWKQMNMANRALQKNIVLEKPSQGSYRERIETLSRKYEESMQELKRRQDYGNSLLKHLHMLWTNLDHPMIHGFEELGDDLSTAKYVMLSRIFVNIKRHAIK